MRREKEFIENLQPTALNDPLTGLPNRNFFYRFAQERLAQARIDKEQISVISIDLDGFKQINDAFGYSVGDHILMGIAQGLKKSLGNRGLLSRLGGDEFIVLLSPVRDVKEVESFVQHLLLELYQPYAYQTWELFVTLSVGISCYPGDGEDIDTLIKQADSAMSHVKENGKNGYQFFSAILPRSCSPFQLANELHRALLREEFSLRYQPQVDIATGTISRMEALIRWQHPKRGLISPDEFVPLAEQVGLIAQIDHWVLSSVCKQIQHWREMGYPPLRVAVNLSLQTFKKNKVTDMIHRILRETGLNANQLEIEMTESWMMRCPEQTVRSLIQLRDMGICLALDDFGGGYSSLNYLKQLPVDVLKIGQRFIRNILTDRHDQIIVRTIIELAHHFEMKVVAEGVETPEQLKLLSETNCDYVQGYLINRPLPASDVEKYFISGTQHFHSLT